MHLIKRYSLACGDIAINKPHIAQKYFPIITDKYITLHTTSKPSKSYDYFQEVVELILPILNKNNITIVQVGSGNETPIMGCYNTLGQTSIAQVAYILNKSLLHIGVDSFPAHFAGAFNIPLVALYSNNFINNVKPYWGDKDKQVLLEPDREKYGKPNFTLDESPKTINTINPELIAKHVCNLLGLEFNYPHKTLYIGSIYNRKSIEVIPDNLFNPQQVGLNSIISRMDITFNEEILQQQLSICQSCIVTNKPISLDILKKFRPLIVELIYFIGPENPPSFEFLKQLKNLKINYKIISDAKDEELNAFKLDIYDYGTINRRNWKKPDDLKNEDLSNFYYKSNKFMVGRGKIYQSEYDYLNDRPIPNLNAVNQKLIDNKYIDRLWRESESCLFSKLDK